MYRLNDTSAHSGDWLFDSGATISATGDRSLLFNAQPSTQLKVSGAGGHILEPTFMSEGLFIFPDEEDSSYLPVKVRILFIPGLQQNILSPADLSHVGKVRYDSDNHVTICPNIGNSEKSYIIARPNESVQNLMFTPKQWYSKYADASVDSTEPTPVLNALTHNNSLLGWHALLGHSGADRLKPFLDSLGFDTPGDFKVLECEACAKCRTTASTLPPRTHTLSQRKLQTLHADCSGMMKLNSKGQYGYSYQDARFFLLVKDDYTGYLWYYALENKGDVAKTLISLLESLQRTFPDSPVECLRTDNGSEFTKDMMKKYLRNHGIRHNCSPAHVPQSNGIIEREMRTVKESGNAMLENAGLDVGFWDLAYRQSVFIINLLPRKSRAGRSKSPYVELYSDKYSEKETYSRMSTYLKTLHVFGESGYYRNPVAVHSKREPRAIEAIYVGAHSDPSTMEVVLPSKGEIRTISGSHFQPIPGKFDLSQLLTKVLTANDLDCSKVKLQNASGQWGAYYRHFRNQRVTGALQDISLSLPDTDNSVADDTSDAQETISALEPAPLLASTDHLLDSSLPVGPDTRTREEDAIYLRSDIGTPVHQYAYSMLTTKSTDPSNYNEAMNSASATEWEAAADVEMQMMYDRNVWTLVPRPPDVKPIHCGWVFKQKLSTLGVPVKHKARLVARGNEQEKKINYDETYSEVVSTDNVLLTLAVAVHNEWTIKQLDVKSAFLYAELDQPVYMYQPEGYEDGTSRVCLLNKSIYGLKQSPREWYKTFSNYLQTIGFDRVTDATGTFIRICDGIKTLLVVYVDDVLVMSSDAGETEKVHSQIADRFDLSESGEPESFLSLHIEKIKGGISIDPRKNTYALLEDSRDIIEATKIRSVTPIVSEDAQISVRIERNERYGTPAGLTGEDKAKAEKLGTEKHNRYRSVVGSLNYLITHGRPDLAFATSQLSRHTNEPRVIHWKMMERVLCYLKQNADLRIIYRKQKDPTLIGYSDATHGGQQVMYTHGGFMWTYGGCLVYWESRKERRACGSIHESELRTLVNCLGYGEYIRNFLLGIKEYSPSKRSICYTDSQSSFKVINNTKISPDTHRLCLHMDRVQDKTKWANIDTEHIEGVNNPADVFTKPLPDTQISKLLSEWIKPGEEVEAELK